MKYLLILLWPILACSDDQIEDAKRSIRSLIQPLIGQNSTGRPKGTEKFRVDQCEKKKIDWMNVLLMKDSVTMDFKFKPGCDIQGSITPKVFSPFLTELDIRNIQSYSHIKVMNKITADLQTKPILNLEMREGILSGKNKVKFEADYRAQINPTAANPVEKNLGGELRIFENNGKKTNIKGKIMVK